MFHARCCGLKGLERGGGETREADCDQGCPDGHPHLVFGIPERPIMFVGCCSLTIRHKHRVHSPLIVFDGLNRVTVTRRAMSLTRGARHAEGAGTYTLSLRPRLQHTAGFTVTWWLSRNTS